MIRGIQRRGLMRADFKAADAVVDATHKYKHLFYEAKSEE